MSLETKLLHSFEVISQRRHPHFPPLLNRLTSAEKQIRHITDLDDCERGLRMLMLLMLLVVVVVVVLRVIVFIFDINLALLWLLDDVPPRLHNVVLNFDQVVNKLFIFWRNQLTKINIHSQSQPTVCITPFSTFHVLSKQFRHISNIFVRFLRSLHIDHISQFTCYCQTRLRVYIPTLHFLFLLLL